MGIRWVAPSVVAALAGVLLLAPSPPRAAATDYDCSDFANQAEAQEYLLSGDPYRLDADSDGIACEDLPCPCSTSSGEEGPAPEATPMPPPPYHLAKSDARRAARKFARKFARRNPRVTSAAVGRCRRRGERRIDCVAIDSGRTSTAKTTCRLRIAVRARNRHPNASLASSRCRTVPILKLTADRARAAIRDKAEEIAGKRVGITELERAAATSFRGLAEWSQPGQTIRENCFVLIEAVLMPSSEIVVSVIESACEPA
jgi:hypothetical protein